MRQPLGDSVDGDANGVGDRVGGQGADMEGLVREANETLDPDFSTLYPPEGCDNLTELVLFFPSLVVMGGSSLAKAVLYVFLRPLARDSKNNIVSVSVVFGFGGVCE